MMKAYRFASGLLVGLLLVLGTERLDAQLPATRLDSVFPNGASPGQTLEVTIAGADLDEVDRLLFSHPGITAKRKMADPTPFDEGPQPVENTFVVTLQANVPAGHHWVRCQGKYGISSPRTFVVDSFTEVLEVEPNNLREEATEVPTLPSSISGRMDRAADVDWFKFTGKAGQRVIVEVYARRVDSQSDSVLAMIAEDGRVLAESRQARAGDPFLDVKLPAAGAYYIRVHDALHGGGAEHSYRLVIGSMPAIEFIFPPAGLPGTNSEYTVYGRNLPGAAASKMILDGQPLEQLKVRIPIPAAAADKLSYSERLDPYQAAIDGVEYRVSSPAGKSNPALVSVATAALVPEQANNDSPKTAQALTLPCEVAGQFYPQRDADWFKFEAKAGDVFWIEVYSHRLGLPTDPTLVVQRVEKTEEGEEKVTQLAWIDDVQELRATFEFDQRTHDPSYEFKAPADGTYRVLVREGHSSVVSDPRLVYRLAIRPAQPDFRLAAVPMDASGAVFLRKGGREAVRVVAFRRDGFDGEIRVSANGLPPGVTSSEMILGPGSNRTTLVLTAAKGAAANVGQLQVTGKAKVGGRDVTRIARLGEPLRPVPFSQPNNTNQPSLDARLTQSLPIVVSGTETERVVLSLTDPGLIKTARGGIVKVKYTVVREDKAGGNIIGFPVGLPNNLRAPQVNIAANKAGEFDIRLLAATPPGTYSFSLVSMIQGMQYSRNPEAAAAAKKRQERINKIYTDSQQKTRVAQQAAQQAQTKLAQATTALSQTTTAKNTADQGATAATAALKTATDALAAAKKLLAAKPADAAAKQQVANATKAVTDATQKAKVATDAATAAAKKLTEAMANQKAAQEAKTKADTESQAAQQFQQQALQEKQRTDQRASQLQSLANPRGYNHIISSTPVTISIAEFPINLTGPPEKASVKQGEKLEVPFKIQRLYGFKQNVSWQMVLPGGVAGLQIQNANIAQNQTDGKITVTAQPTATPGDHTVTLRGTMNFNGQGLTMERKLVLTVVKVEQPKK